MGSSPITPTNLRKNMVEKIYGPYLRKDGRKHVIRINYDVEGKEISRRTQSYPRYLIEQHTGEEIPADIEVDHSNRDTSDNHPSNYQLLERRYHRQLDATYRDRSEVSCACCGKVFIPSKDQVNKRALRKTGPFCSNSCRGKGALIATDRTAPAHYRISK